MTPDQIARVRDILEHGMDLSDSLDVAALTALLDAVNEREALRDLIRECLAAGFYGMYKSDLKDRMRAAAPYDTEAEAMARVRRALGETP